MIDYAKYADSNVPLPCSACRLNLRPKPSSWLSLTRWRKAVLSETPSRSTTRSWFGRMKLVSGGMKNLPRPSTPVAAAMLRREIEIAVTTQNQHRADRVRCSIRAARDVAGPNLADNGHSLILAQVGAPDQADGACCSSARDASEEAGQWPTAPLIMSSANRASGAHTAGWNSPLVLPCAAARCERLV